MRKQIFVYISIILGLPSNAFSQDTLNILYYPSAKDFIETVHASASLKGDSLIYSFLVENSTSSPQAIYSFHIGISSLVRNASVPTGWRVRIGEGVQAIPRVMWWSSDSIHNVLPGMVLGGFSFTSRGLPSIRNYYAKAFVLPPIVDVEPDSIVGGGRFLDSRKIGKTLAPVDPPNPFIPLDFLDTLISYKHQAVTLGWLKDRREDQKDEDDEEKEDGIVAKLDKRLGKARAELLKGDSIKARKELEKFVKKVEKLYKESDKEEDKNKPEKVVITSEGFALLKYNAEYLIDRLPKKQK
jgi:hypothetical protein